MKKKAKKLRLAKETLHSMLPRAVGADTAAFDWCMGSMLCQPAPCPTHAPYASCAPNPQGPIISCMDGSNCGGEM